MPQLRLDQYFSCFLLLLATLCAPLASRAQITELKPRTQLEALPILSENFFIPMKKSEQIPPPKLTATAAIVYDPQNGAIIFEKSIDEKLPQASLTKLMTALVAIELYELDEIVTIQNEEYNTESNVMGLQEGEQISVENLLKGLLIFSANDAALALANHNPAGPEDFIARMNAKAQDLHLTRTSFQNTPGFDNEGHHSTAFDLAILSKEVLEQPQLALIMQTQYDEVSDVTGSVVHPLQSTNELLDKLSGLIAGKTGKTELAGECLITEVNRNGHPIITVVLGSEDRFTDTATLVDWVYNYFEWKSPVQTDLNTEL